MAVEFHNRGLFTLSALAAMAFAALVCPAPRARAGEAAPKPGAEEEAGKDAEEIDVEEFTDDLIVLKSDLAIEGKVVGRDARNVLVLVEYGTLAIPRAAVKYIDYNLASRLSEVGEEDYEARYEILAQAVEQGNMSQARRHLEELVGKPGVPPEIYAILARIYEAEGELAKALESWKKYALAAPDDAEAKERIAALTEQLAAPGAAAGKADGTPGGGAPGPAGPAPDGLAVEEGLEAGGKWQVLGWGNSAAVSIQEIEGNKVVMIDVPAGGTKDKAAVERQGRLDLSEYSALAFRAFSGEKARAQVALALITSKDYYESRTVGVNPGWNMDLAFDLQGKQWKSKATGWTFKAAVEGLDSVRQVIFLVYCGKRKALLYLDHVRAE